METKFNSQICTTKEQSERLLALGLKKETADMHLFRVRHKEYWSQWHPKTDPYSKLGFYAIRQNSVEYIPAWSLHRLMEMMPTLIYRRERQYWLDINNDGVCYNTNGGFACVEYIADNLYDNILYCIEWLIKEGYFNKEYLV